jgi:hypothetical protein
MRTIATTTVPSGIDRRGPRSHSFGAALVALFVALVAITATVVISWQGSTSHRAPAVTRVVGPDTFVGSVYDEQVPAAANPLRAGTVYREQVPGDGPLGNQANGVKGLDDDSALLSGIGTGGNQANGVKGLDDDSAAVMAGRPGAPK